MVPALAHLSVGMACGSPAQEESDVAETADKMQPDRQRERIRQLLAGGLETDWRRRAYEDADVQRVIGALKALDKDDLEGRLRIAGFTLTPYENDELPGVEQCCKTCMYYEAHRRHCALPELDLHAEPEWSCILWRI